MKSNKKSVVGLVDFAMLSDGESVKESKDSSVRTVVFCLPGMLLM
jgi:hypothetical protein